MSILSAKHYFKIAKESSFAKYLLNNQVQRAITLSSNQGNTYCIMTFNEASAISIETYWELASLLKKEGFRIASYIPGYRLYISWGNT